MNAVSRGSVSLRRRSGWEAADMGTLLWQRNWPALLLFFGVPGGLLIAALCFLPEDMMIYGGCVFWWLRTFLDRFALHVVSVRFFEPDAGFKRLFKGLGKTLRRGITGDLFWRRFSPFRSARMPFIVLEGLKGNALKKRRCLLSPRGLYFGFPVTVVCLALNSVLLYGEIAFIAAIFEFIQPGYLAGEFWEHLSGFSTLGMILSWFNLLFVETLFVCMGFGLYINTRVETEGWDIELLFKKYTEKAKPALQNFKKTAALVLALAFFLVPNAAGAQNREAKPSTTISGEKTPASLPPPAPEQFAVPSLSPDSADALDTILESAEFGSEKPSWDIRLKKDIDFDPDLDLKWRDLKFPWLKEFTGIALRAILVLAAAFMLVCSARYFYRRRAVFMPKKAALKSRELPGGGDDPVRLLEQAEALHQNGAIREAWALCFRAFLAAFGVRRGRALPSETTEYEALALAGEQSGGFCRFVAQWIGLAYGGADPADGGFEQALADCRLLFSDENGSGGNAP
jgi:hypothetical protein